MQRVPTYRPTLAEALGGDLTDAEKLVLAAAKLGTTAEISPRGVRPVTGTKRKRVGAGLIRFLLLGGDDTHPVHPRGVLIRGAWITGKLDMVGCESQLDLKLTACHFDTGPDFTDVHLGGLYLVGCHVPSLFAHRIRLEEALQLRALRLEDRPPLAFSATGPVDIAGAQISGQLVCDGGRFTATGGKALNCDGMTVGGNVFLSDGFHAVGQVNLTGATITGQLNCKDGRFDGAGDIALDGSAMTVKADVKLTVGFHATGQVDLTRAKIAGDLNCRLGRIEGQLNLRTAHVEQQFILKSVQGGGPDGPWRRGQVVPVVPEASQLSLDLTESKVGVLVDDSASWTQVTRLRLSGFRYASIQSKMTLMNRLELFRRHTSKRGFDAGPYTQHAKFLRRLGHRVDADRVLFLRERLLRKAERDEAWGRGGKWRFFATLMMLRDSLFQTLIGYGYRPAYALLWSVAIITLSTFFFADVYAVGQFAPNSDVILNSEHWLAAVERSDALLSNGLDVPPLMLWTGQTGATRPMPPSVDYETFGPFLYAVDLFLPLDTIGQTEAWAPSKDRGGWGSLGYYARMPIQLMGWLITALVAALLAGLIGKRDD
jgi:hypothetical protein